MCKFWMLGGVAVIAAAGAWADRAEQRQCLAPPTATLWVENPAGLVELVGWDREEVVLDARLGNGVAALHFDCEDAQVRVRVEVKRRARDGDATLRFQVPRGASIVVDTASAQVDVRDVTGRKEIQSASGRVLVAADSSHLRARTVSGNLSVTGFAPEMDLSTTSGLLTLSGGADRLALATVSGRVEVDGTYGIVNVTAVSGGVTLSGTLESVDVKSVSGRVDVGKIQPGPAGYPRLRVRTISGNVAAEGLGLRELDTDTVSARQEFRGNFGPAPRVEARSVSGGITLDLDGPLDAAIHAESRSGRVDIDLPGAQRRSEPGMGNQVTTAGGAGSARLVSQSGGIRVRVP